MIIIEPFSVTNGASTVYYRDYRDLSTLNQRRAQSEVQVALDYSQPEGLCTSLGCPALNELENFILPASLGSSTLTLQNYLGVFYIGAVASSGGGYSARFMPGFLRLGNSNSATLLLETLVYMLTNPVQLRDLPEATVVSFLYAYRDASRDRIDARTLVHHNALAADPRLSLSITPNGIATDTYDVQVTLA